MISRIKGTLVSRDLERVEIMTASGVAYEISIPTTTFEKLPPVGSELELLVQQVLREDASMLFGFLEPGERMVFARLLTASGVGPRLALAMLSALPAHRLVSAVRNRDIAALTTVSGVGKKTAERLVIDLATRLDDIPLEVGPAGSRGASADEAMRALTVLGFSSGEAEKAIREAVDKEGPMPAQDLIRVALQYLR